MPTNYNTIAEEYRRAKLQPWRLHIEVYTLFGLVGDVAGKSVLDLACGEGFHTRLLKQHEAARVAGVDISAGMISLARRNPTAPGNRIPGRGCQEVGPSRALRPGVRGLPPELREH